MLRTQAGVMTQDHWLDITEAAELLHLHPSTLRRWADDGKIAHSKSVSGRRRFERSVIEQFALQMNQPVPQAAVEQKVPETLEISRQHTKDLARAQADWAMLLNEEQRLVFRYSGQRLLGLLMQYISRSDEGESFLEEAKKIAGDYGRIFHKIGLTIPHGVESFLYFRRSILESVQSTSGVGGIEDQNGVRVSLRTSDFFDSFLVAMVESQTRARDLNS
jgi:excisionase family DNA binding protein